MLLKTLQFVLTAMCSVYGIENVAKSSLTAYSPEESTRWPLPLSDQHSEEIIQPQDDLRFEDQTLPRINHPIKFEDNRIDDDDDRYRKTTSDNGQIKFIDHVKSNGVGNKIKYREQSLDYGSIYDDENSSFDNQGVSNYEGSKEKRVKFDIENESPKSLLNEVLKERVVFHDDGTSREPEEKRKGRRRPRYKKPKYSSSMNSPDTKYPTGFSGYGLAYPYAPSYLGNPNPGYHGISDMSYTGYTAPYPGYVNPGYPSGFAGPFYPGQNYPSVYPDLDFQASLGQNQGFLSYNDPPLYQPGYPSDPGTRPDYQGQHRPSRRPKSLASQAVSAVAEALTSIAMYDDYECVPRLLCEAAGGRATGSSALLTAASGLQPLITMLSAYNGASSSPLFVFGRAVILGATSKGNTASCRYAYPQCPTDPEQLIVYLNNHNGGFFRFFNSPQQLQQTQNLEQFYNQLSGQYGFYKPNGNQQDFGTQTQIGNGLQNHNLNDNLPYYGSKYGHSKYGFQNTYKDAKEIASKIQDRIQNKPTIQDLEDDINEEYEPNSKWLFPDQTFNERKKKPLDRDSKTLKFPDEYQGETTGNTGHVRKGKSILFPGQGINYISNYYQYQTTTPVNLDDYFFDNKYNIYVKKEKPTENYRRPNIYNKYRDDDGLTTIYIVRGNGDPNHPEIVKIKPGQSLT